MQKVFVGNIQISSFYEEVMLKDLTHAKWASSSEKKVF